ncbi:MAG: urease accessory protein UreF [Muribaculaceae bacterium]|nr:urease accessory protein UreF [Muribaculaceae bacterium]
MASPLINLMRLIQFTDSTFPVGTFSFSNGLESAAYENLVTDAKSLEQYTRAASLQAAYSDGIAALNAYKAVNAGDYDTVTLTDRRLMLFKMNDEARLMLRRMGKKLAELAVRFYPDNEICRRFLKDIETDATPGSFPVAQGVIFAVAGLSPEELFSSHQYGVINMILAAALRCVRVSHLDTQEILLRLTDEAEKLYPEVSEMEFEDMNAFVPEMDIMASLHEKGKMRMFMN